jgi:hypothetical protein
VRRGEAEGRNSDSEAKALIIKMKTDWRHRVAHWILED